MNFLLISNKKHFVEVFSRNLSFIWKDSKVQIVAAEENLQSTNYSVIFIDATDDNYDYIDWFNKSVLNKQIPVIFITLEKNPAYSKAALDAGAKAVLAKNELTKKKIQNAVDTVLLVPDTTIEVTDNYYIDEKYTKPRLKGYRVLEKISQQPECWEVSKRDIDTQAQAYIFDYFSNIQDADKAKQKFKLLTEYENKHVMTILDAGLLPGHVGKIFLVQKTYTDDLRQITPGSMSAALILKSLVTAFESLDQLHALGFVCGFLHPDYFFLNKQNELVISLAPILAYPKKRSNPFASPERKRGEFSDPRSDYFSIAAAFHYFISGEVPLAGQEIAYSGEYSQLERIIGGALAGPAANRYKSFKEFSRFVEIKCASILETH